MKRMIFIKQIKKFSVFLILFILIIDCSGSIGVRLKSTKQLEKDSSNSLIDHPVMLDQQDKATKNPYGLYKPQNIEPKDAAYHKSINRFNVEWWYFEGIFDNGYSVIIGFLIISKNDFGICISGIRVYNNTKMKDHADKIVLLKECKVSEDYPFLQISEKQYMDFDEELYNNRGEWVYHVSIDFKRISANLQFIGTTDGYKGNILRGWYGPVLPKAIVNGTLCLNGKEINVIGNGYHEHAWEIHPPVWEYGWNWGKIASDSFNILWVKMMESPLREQQRFAVFSQDQLDYIHISSQKIKFKPTNYKIINCRILPTKFILKVIDPDNSIYINLTMDMINVHHVSGFINCYWRYHVKVNGQISYKSTTENLIDKIQIIELVRFPSLFPIL